LVLFLEKVCVNKNKDKFAHENHIIKVNNSEMNSTLKKTIFKALVAVVFLSIAYFAKPVFSHQILPFETHQASWFGVGGGEYTPYEAVTPYDTVRTQVLWMIFIAFVLLIVVIAFVFDIAHFTYKITGKKVADINKVSAWICIIILVVGVYFAFWELFAQGKYAKVGNPSAAHGVALDNMFMFTFVLTFAVFILTEILLFVFPFLYRTKEGRKAYYYPENNKLEIFWTAVPFIILVIMAFRGNAAWKEITYNPEAKNADEIEVFAYQFGWSARYPGQDGKFGAASFNYISGTNPLGLAVKSEVAKFTEELKKDTADCNKKIANVSVYLSELNSQLIEYQNKADFKGVKDTEKEIENVKCGKYVDELKLTLRRRTKQLERMALLESDKDQYAKTFNGDANDDLVVKEIVIQKGKAVRFKFRSRDVIHSAFAPDFRLQMNTVPGMSTYFVFVPTKTTAEARAEKGDEEFNYYIYCNKVCGQAHFNMKIKITVVETEAEYKEWIGKQKPSFAETQITNSASMIAVTDSHKANNL